MMLYPKPGTVPALFLRLLKNPVNYVRRANGITLRSYQVDPFKAVLKSVLRKHGHTFVVIFPRQSGKNELQAQLQAYLLKLFSMHGGEMVQVSPTWKPQSLNAMSRLERVLENGEFTRTHWQKESGYIYRIDKARIAFLSGEPTANIVGATASVLLSVDEAQDIRPDKYDKDIAPMAASSNATRIFWGTAWTSDTLLGRELRAARAQEAQDGIRRAFVVTADEVGAELPAYRRFAAEQVARLGRQHPLVRTQFYSEEIDGGGGMFPPERLARVVSASAPPPESAPKAGAHYAVLIDVAGQDERAGAGPDELANPQRDATAVTVVAAEPQRAGAPVYRCVLRKQWLGVRHADLLPELVRLAETWRARWVVVDATGVGAGLASFLERSLPGRVLPFTFTAASKSKLGWDFLALVDGGRWVESPVAALGEEFRAQLAACTYSAAGGTEKRLRWGVPDGGKLHDDLVISAALATVLDEQPWSAGAPAVVIRGRDPLDEMDG